MHVLPRAKSAMSFLNPESASTFARMVSMTLWTPSAKKRPLKLSRTNVPALGLSASSASSSSWADANAAVLDDGPGGVVGVVQPVVGDDAQALGLVHIRDDRRAAERVKHARDSLRRVLPDPVNELLLRAYVVGDVFRTLIRRQFLGDKLRALGDKVFQVAGSIRLQQERQPIKVRGEKLHPSLRLQGPMQTGSSNGYLPEEIRKCRGHH